MPSRNCNLPLKDLSIRAVRVLHMYAYADLFLGKLLTVVLCGVTIFSLAFLKISNICLSSLSFYLLGGERVKVDDLFDPSSESIQSGNRAP